MFHIIEHLIRYAQTTSPARMVFHTFMFLAVVTWLGVVTLVAGNFNTLYSAYQNYKRSKPVEVETALIITNQVNTLLEEQRALMDVDRVYVAKFHDGKTDVNGVHFIYFSRVAESTGAGVSNEITMTQNLPLSIFPAMLRKLAEKECYFVEDVSPSVSNFGFLREMGIQSMLVCPIWNGTGRLIGLVGVDAVRKPLNTQDRTRIEAALVPLSTVLGGLLSIR